MAGSQEFNVRNMPYVNQDDSRYAEALQDIINKVSAQQKQISALEARLAAAKIP